MMENMVLLFLKGLNMKTEKDKRLTKGDFLKLTEEMSDDSPLLLRVDMVIQNCTKIECNVNDGYIRLG